MSTNSVLHISNENFDQEILKSPIPVLVDFWAPWCGPCRMVGPVVEELALEFTGQVKVAKLNTDEHPELAQQYRVMSIPTLMLFENGRVVDMIIGAQPKAQLKSFLQKAVKDQPVTRQ